MTTKQTSLDVTGTVDDQSTVTVKVNGSDPMPAVMNGNDFSLTDNAGLRDKHYRGDSHRPCR